MGEMARSDRLEFPPRAAQRVRGARLWSWCVAGALAALSLACQAPAPEETGGGDRGSELAESTEATAPAQAGTPSQGAASAGPAPEGFQGVDASAHPADAVRPGGLRRAVGLTFGAPLPEGLELVQRNDDVARFRTDHPFDALLAFYDRELEGYGRRDDPDGAKFSPIEGEGADIYVLHRDDEDPNRRLVVYFRVAPPEPVEASRGQSAPATIEETEPRRDPSAPVEWPAGLVIPPEHPLGELAHEMADGPRQIGHYEVHTEERDGRRVRVLIPRPAPSPGTPAVPSATPRPGQGRLQGPYQREDGQLSLTPPRRFDRDGNPLPFGGYRQVEVGDDPI